jgi:hypothetical protein
MWRWVRGFCYGLAVALALSHAMHAHAQTAVTGTSVTFHFDVDNTAFDGTPLDATTAVTYNIYASSGCGQKSLASGVFFDLTKPGKVYVTLPAAPGCLSVAVSASDSGGEGQISPTITFQVTAPPPPVKRPAQVVNLAPG